MEGPLETAAKAPRTKPAHLMCGTRLWGFAGAIVCGYFAYLAYARLRDADILWSNNLWSLLTCAVWIVLVLGLISETRCWRERAFFGIVLLDLAMGLTFSLWTAAPLNYAHQAREASLLGWVLAAVASLMTLVHPHEEASQMKES